MKYKWLIAGLLIVALLGLCGGMVAASWVGIAQLRESGVRLRMFQADTVSAQADEEQRFTVDGPATLSVANRSGKVVVTAGAGDEIVVTAHKTAWGSSQADAEAALAGIKVVVTQEGNAVTVKVEQPVEVDVIHIGPGGGSVDFTITVPEETAVTAETSSGEITLSGTRDAANLYNGYGDITVTDVAGSLEVKTNSGEVEARNIQAGKGAIDLHSDYGNIILEHAAANKVSLDSNSGAIRLADVQAASAITLDSGYGPIRFEGGRAAALSVEASSGATELTGVVVSGTLTVRSSYGDVDMAQVTASSYDLNTSSGDITVNGAGGGLRAYSGYGDITVTHGDHANLVLWTNSGAIEYSGSLGEGPHTLHSDYGNVRLTIPDDTALTFDLKTDYGKVKSALPVTLSGDLEEKHWEGTINGGGASLTVTTNSGDIRIEILEP